MNSNPTFNPSNPIKTHSCSTRSLKLVVVLCAVSLFSIGGLFANYSALTTSTGYGSFGVIGLGYNTYASLALSGSSY